MAKNTRIIVFSTNFICRQVINQILKGRETFDYVILPDLRLLNSVALDFPADMVIVDSDASQRAYEEITKIKVLEAKPVLVLTAKDNEVVGENGFVDYLKKPFSPASFCQWLELKKNLVAIQSELNLRNIFMREREKILKYEVEKRTNELLFQLYVDSLTGLPNRMRMLEDIHASENPTLILVNIDSFKEINNFYGHNIGDLVLVELCERLKMICSENNGLLYRLHADEFAILIQEKIERAELTDFVSELHRIGKIHPYSHEGQDIMLDISLGISHDYQKDDILEKADMALKLAKKNRSNWLFYNSSMALIKEYGENIKWTKIINKALRRQKVITYFQPIFNNVTNQAEKYETLVRIINEAGDLVLPFYFLNAAKRSKQYHEITKSVIRDSCRIFKDRKEEFTINISTEDIQNEEIFQYILSCAQEYKIGQRLILEILESEGISDYKSVCEFIRQVKKIGCKIALDDFGSGYSNFDHILRLDIDFIKLDASLIEKLDEDDHSVLIVETIVNFCRKLNIKTIAEMVHSKKIWQKVINLGIDYSQGFYLGRPISALGF